MEDLDKLSNLSRELSLSSVSYGCILINAHQNMLSQLQQSPEDYIKQTLLAHGFFSHSNCKPKVLFLHILLRIITAQPNHQMQKS